MSKNSSVPGHPKYETAFKSVEICVERSPTSPPEGAVGSWAPAKPSTPYLPACALREADLCFKRIRFLDTTRGDLACVREYSLPQGLLSPRQTLRTETEALRGDQLLTRARRFAIQHTVAFAD